jgi:hypothetical protein
MNTTAAAPEMPATEWKTEEWGMGTLIVAHLRSHENQWPPSWEDLLNRRGRSSTRWLSVQPIHWSRSLSLRAVGRGHSFHQRQPDNVSRPGRAPQSSVSCPPISRTRQTGVWQNAILTVQWASSLENKRPCFATQVGDFPVA